MASAQFVIAIGGSKGTSNEIKLALQNDKTVIAVSEAPEPEKPHHLEPKLSGKKIPVCSVDEAIKKALKLAGLA